MHDMDKYVRVTLSVTRTKMEQAESELRLASSKEFVGGNWSRVLGVTSEANAKMPAITASTCGPADR